MTWSVMGLCLLTWSSRVAAEQPGLAQQAGEKIDKVFRGIKRSVAGASDAVRVQFDRVRTSVHNMELEPRIYSRLHWDKALHSPKSW